MFYDFVVIYRADEKIEEMRKLVEEKTKDYQMTQEDIKQYQEEDIVAKIEELTQLLQDTHQIEEPQVVNQYIKK